MRNKQESPIIRGMDVGATVAYTMAHLGYTQPEYEPDALFLQTYSHLVKSKNNLDDALTMVRLEMGAYRGIAR